jgi:hypothetical protein
VNLRKLRAEITWEAHFDEGRLSIEKQVEEPCSHTIGGATVEVFLIRPVVAGPSEVDFDYKQPWERESLRSHRLRILADE